MIQTRKRINLRSIIFLLLIGVAAVGLCGALLPVSAAAAGQNSNQARTRTPVHPRKQVHISCRQICLADYDACKDSHKRGARHGVCETSRSECLAECSPAK
jgi:hypothetical protein